MRGIDFRYTSYSLILTLTAVSGLSVKGATISTPRAEDLLLEKKLKELIEFIIAKTITTNVAIAIIKLMK